MAKTRMTEGQRRRFRDLAEKLVKPTAQFNALTKAYEKAAPRVRKCVEAKYPPKDMDICKKYNVAFGDDCVKLQLTSGGVNRFTFTDGEGPVVAGGCQIYLADEATTNAFESWRQAAEAYETERVARLRAYHAVIAAAQFVEEVIEVWPEVAAHIPKRQELIAVNDEVLAQIRADQRERAKAA